MIEIHNLKAIDDVYMSSTPCPQPADCDFEEVDDNFKFCSWANVNREIGAPVAKKSYELTSKALPLNGSIVTLICKGTNNYWCAESGGNSYVVADRGELAAWELFKLFFNDDNTVSIVSMTNNKYVYLLSINSFMYLTYTLDDSSKFELVTNSDGSYGLRSIRTTKYVTGKNNPNINSFYLMANKGKISFEKKNFFRNK